MNASTPEQREGAVVLAAGEIRVRAGFRVVTTELLAGGPVELEFFVESLGLVPLQLAVSGDRMRRRPGQFNFTARFEGLPLEDPMAVAPYRGGPMGVVQVSTGSPWHQPLVLNQFIRLENTVGRLNPGLTGRLDLACRRSLALAATDAAALSNDAVSVAAVNLAFDLRRDDAALTALATRLFNETVQGPVASREQALTLLLSMREAASDQIDALAKHPDSFAGERARRIAIELRKHHDA